MAMGERGDELTGKQATFLTGYLGTYGGEALITAGAPADEHQQLVEETRIKIDALGLSELTTREYYALMVGVAMSTQAMRELMSMGASPEEAANVVNLGVAGLHSEVVQP